MPVPTGASIGIAVSNVITPPQSNGFRMLGGPQPAATASFRNFELNLPYRCSRFYVTAADDNIKGQVIIASIQPLIAPLYFNGDGIYSGPSPNDFVAASSGEVQGWFIQKPPSAGILNYRELLELCEPVSKIYITWNMASPTVNNRFMLGFNLAKTLAVMLAQP